MTHYVNTVAIVMLPDGSTRSKAKMRPATACQQPAEAVEAIISGDVAVVEKSDAAAVWASLRARLDNAKG